MQAGLLRDKIIFEENKPERDKFGGISDKWIKAFKTRAYVKFNSGNRKEIVGEIVNTSSVCFTVRYRKEIHNKMRIIYENSKYRITSLHRDRTLQATIIQAELINE